MTHPLARCALAQAERLADLFAPTTPAQHEAKQRLTEAIRAGDLPQTVEAIRAMKQIGARARPMSTPEWRAWAQSWLDTVDQLGVCNG